MTGGSLKTYQKRISKPRLGVIKKWAGEILKGLKYLHSQEPYPVIHRDIKCSNLLVNQDGTLKLSDFGASKRLIEGNDITAVSHSLKGSPYWMAPEVAKRIGHSFPADIWSVGCTVVEMATGSPPWANLSKDVRGVLELIRSAEAPPELPEELSDPCRNFVKRCLQIESYQRPTAQQLLLDPFIIGKLN